MQAPAIVQHLSNAQSLVVNARTASTAAAGSACLHAELASEWMTPRCDVAPAVCVQLARNAHSCGMQTGSQQTNEIMLL